MAGSGEKKLSRPKFQDRLRKSFMGYICAIIAAILALCFGGFVLNFINVVVKDCREANQQLSSRLEAQATAYEDGLLMLVQDPKIQAVLTQETSAAWTDANQQLYQFVNAQNLKAYFVLLDDTGRLVCSNFNERNQESFVESSFTSSVIARLNKAPKKLMCFACSAPLTSDQMCCYTFCRIVPGENGSKEGYLFFNLREDGFRESAHAFSQEVLLTDRYDNIVYTTLDPEEDPLDKLPSGKYPLEVSEGGISKIRGEYHYVSTSVITTQELRLYTLTPLSLQIQTLWYGLFLFIFLLFILAAIVWILPRIFARQNAKELGELAHAVKRMEQNNTDDELPPQCSEESQLLFTQFRNTTLHLQELSQRNSELMDRRRQMEIKQLEEQFNPHFVFNVMETVRYQIQESPETASEMLLSFANLMRYSINYGHTKVSLETDVEYVNDYLLLQKVRYNNCLHYEFRIPESLLECQIPKLLLQPVIENSIKHGYQPGKTLDIMVEAEQRGDDLRFVVQDNGKGIEESRLGAIRESFTMELNSDYVKHIGLYNVQKVIELLYGSHYGLEIESALGKGTRVVLTMPCEVETET